MTKSDAARDELGAESVLVETNGVRLHTVRAGPTDGPLVVLLHGFPEYWYGWRHQIRPLADAGYRVVVPDQRGYGWSEKPDGVSPYRLDELAADVVGIADDAGRETAAVVGHDWGAEVAWWTALAYPDRVSRLGALNVPHPTAMREALRDSWSQRRKSWYMAFFQLPRLPEYVLRRRGYAGLEATMTDTSDPGTFDGRDFERYREAWRRPGALTASLNWYRAVGRERPHPPRERVSPPTLVCWGERDAFLDRSLADASAARCDDATLVTLDATHWVHHERPERVADELLGLLAD